MLAGVALIALTALTLLIKRRIRLMAERYQQTPGRFPSPKGVLMFLLPLPVNIVTLGLFTLVLNGLMLYFTAGLLKGVAVSGLGAAILGSVVISIVSTLVNCLARSN